MTRGDLLIVAGPSEFGKPRPAVVVQSDALAVVETVLVCLLKSTLRDAPAYRLRVDPDVENGFRQVSDIMVDKVYAIRLPRCGEVIGRMSKELTASLDSRLAFALGLADG